MSRGAAAREAMRWRGAAPGGPTAGTTAAPGPRDRPPGHSPRCRIVDLVMDQPPLTSKDRLVVPYTLRIHPDKPADRRTPRWISASAEVLVAVEFGALAAEDGGLGVPRLRRTTTPADTAVRGGARGSPVPEPNRRAGLTASPWGRDT